MMPMLETRKERGTSARLQRAGMCLSTPGTRDTLREVGDAVGTHKGS